MTAEDDGPTTTENENVELGGLTSRAAQVQVRACAASPKIATSVAVLLHLPRRVFVALRNGHHSVDGRAALRAQVDGF